MLPPTWRIVPLYALRCSSVHDAAVGVVSADQSLIAFRSAPRTEDCGAKRGSRLRKALLVGYLPPNGGKSLGRQGIGCLTQRAINGVVTVMLHDHIDTERGREKRQHVGEGSL